MKRLMVLLAFVPALAWSCSDDSGNGGATGGVGGVAGTASTEAGSAGTAGDTGGAAGSAGTSAGTAGTAMGMAGADTETGLSFETDIHPFLVQKCSGEGCHSSGSALPEHASDLVADAYAATQQTSSAGNLVHERMVERTRGDDADLVMPPSYADPGCDGPPGSSEGCLTEAEFELLEEWSEQGAPP